MLTLSGTATLAQYEQALRSVGFSNATSDTPGTTRSIQFKITTPIASNTTSKTIAITEVNDPPVVNLDAPGALSYPEQSGFVNLFGAERDRHRPGFGDAGLADGDDHGRL